VLYIIYFVIMSTSSHEETKDEVTPGDIELDLN